MKWKNHSLENACYFVTTTLRKFTPLFSDDKIVCIVFDSLEYLRQNQGLKVYAYVIMPNHIHLIVGCDSNDIITIVGNFKSYTSRDIAKYLKENKPELFERLKQLAYKGQNYGVWQKTFRSEVIYEESFMNQKLNYIYNNPVKRGLAKSPDGWKYSSYKQLEDDTIVSNGIFKIDIPYW